MNTAQPMYEWNTIPWQKLERNVFKLQKRIYQASKRGDSRQVKRLQRLLIKSWSTKILAVKKVTQDNTGKKTAGVDGVKSLTPEQRLELVKNLNLKEKAKPIRRVWIPKPGKSEKRPLGIPVMRDRASQALIKMAIEPQWEAKFEPNSFGFRPGRSCHDAHQALHDILRHREQICSRC
jgi:RNA-directed DNA polymerase